MKNKMISRIILMTFLLLVCASNIYAQENISINNISYTTTSTNVETIMVNTAEEFMDAIANDSDADIILGSDLNFFQEYTTEKSIISVTFTGSIDGNGYAIKNLSTALFNTISNATIKNLIFSNIYIENVHINGLLANNANYTIIDNVHIIDSFIKSTTTTGFGSFVGMATGIEITNSTISNSTFSAAQRIGGLISYNFNKSTFTNVRVSATLNSSNRLGGIAAVNYGELNVSDSILDITYDVDADVSNADAIIASSSSSSKLVLNNILLAPSIDNIAVGSNRTISTNNVYITDNVTTIKDYEWLNTVSLSKLNNDFYINTLNLDSSIWNTNNNLPSLTIADDIINAFLLRDAKTQVNVETVEALDEKIIAKGTNDIDQELEMLLMQRYMVDNVGYTYLVGYASLSQSNAEFVNWLYNDYRNLTAYTLGGAPDTGNFIAELNVLKMLYDEYKDDLSAVGFTKYGNQVKDVYHTLFFSIGKTYSTTIRMWTALETDELGPITSYDHPSVSHPVTRYEVFKRMYNNDLLGYQDTKYSFVNSSLMFENLEVEEMRYVVNSHLDDQSLEWQNWYMTSDLAKENERLWSEYNKFDPYTYMDYTFGFNYHDEEYVDDANFAYYDERYNLSAFGITDIEYGSPKQFVIFDEGGICWGISKVGANIWTSLGVPSSPVYQPGHVAYVFSRYDANTDTMYWTDIYNSVSSWGETGEGYTLPMHDAFYTRMPLGWGDDASASFYKGSYIGLSQQVLNDFETYTDSSMYMLLANTYESNTEVLEELYRKAISINPLDYNAWLNLTKLYINDDTKTNNDLLALLEEISTNLAYNPLPINDLFKLVLPELQDDNTAVIAYTRLLNDSLIRDSKATFIDTPEPLISVQTANTLLGYKDSTLASFSFDGNDANKIILSDSRFGSNQVTWDYSLDGGNTWTQIIEKSVELSKEELATITSANDIIVHIVGVSYEEENLFRIDIKEADKLSNIYLNDLENNLHFSGRELEYFNTETNTWLELNSNVIFDGLQDVQVRSKAIANTLASTPQIYSFTDDIYPANKTYYSLDNVNLISAPKAYDDNRKQENMFDGNKDTYYYTSERNDKEIIFSFDTPIKLSTIEYLPYQTNVGRIMDATIYGSIDGEEYFIIDEVKNLENSYSLKTFTIDNPKEVNFVKLVVTKTSNTALAITMFNFYEDTREFDDTVLVASIEKATNIYNDLTYNKTIENKEIFNTAINTAKDILANVNIDQTMIDEAINKLENAITTYINSKDAIDRTKLEDTIDYANSVYNDTTLNKLSSNRSKLYAAIFNANVIYTSNQANQSHIDNAIVTLSTAIETYLNSEEVLDKTLLENTISNANNTLNNTSYNKAQSSKDALKTAINNASNILNNATKQSELNNAASTLESAISTYINSKDLLNKDVLESTINNAQSIYDDTSIVKSKESKNQLYAAIFNANVIYTSNQANQSHIDNAVVTLNNAIETYLNSADLLNKNVLENTITKANTTLNDTSLNKTAESRSSLEYAIKSANITLNSNVSKQSDIDYAVTILNNAITTYVNSKDELNKDALIVAVNNAQAVYDDTIINKGEYAKNNLYAAIFNANIVLDNTLIGQNYVDNAVVTLNNALNTYLNAEDVIERSILEEKINYAQSLYDDTTLDKTQAQRNNLLAAIYNAKSIFGSNQANQTHINGAVDSLQSAIDTFLN